ncbi:MAG: phage major capsid protein [Hydrogenophaga sp.]|nr:phage major capsid protein [Hydrogenophaga sp.]
MKKSVFPKALALATTAAAVAAFFGFPAATASTLPVVLAHAPDDETTATLRAQVVRINHEAQAIRARASAEGRDLEPAEADELARLIGEFDQIDARLALHELPNEARAQSQPRRTLVNRSLQGSASDGSSPIGRRYSAPVVADATARAGLIPQGYRNAAAALFGNARSDWDNPEEFFRSVASGIADPRLIRDATGVSGVGVDGGFAVPVEFYRGVVEQALQVAEFAPRCRVFAATSNSLIVPMPDAKNRASGIACLTAFWTGEAQTRTAQTLKWRAVELKLHKTFIHAEASSELAEDGLGYAAQLTQHMAAATAYAIDAALLYGDGVGKPLGLIASPSAISVTPESGQAPDTIVFDNLVNLYARLMPECQKRAVWYLSPAALPQMLAMRHPGSDHPVLLSGGQNDAAAGAPAMTIFGRPVVVTEIAPTLGDAGDLVFADFSQYALLMKSTARVEMDLGPGFARDVQSWRTIMRVGGQPLWDAPVQPYNGGPTLSWATYLAPRA